MKLEILTDPNPKLRIPTKEVVSFDMELQTFIDNMVETMRVNQGVGLAAPQVSSNKKIVVLEHDAKDGKEEKTFKPFPLTIICNPKIIKKSKKEVRMVEGCLSFPNFFTIIKRPKEVIVSGNDRYGEKIEIKASAFQARVLQHEIDHLNSILLSDQMGTQNIVIFATGDFGLKTLERLNSDPQYKILRVYTNPKKTLTRGKVRDRNNIKKLSKKFGLKCEEVSDINTGEFIEKLKKLDPDLGVVVDFGQIISKDVFSIPKYGILNVHPSLLPKHRGPSPIQDSILSGDKNIGVTIIKIDEGCDTGAIIGQSEIKLEESYNYKVLFDYLGSMGASLLLDVIPYYLTGEIKAENQKEKDASMSKIIKKSDGAVDFNTKEKVVHRKVMALSPWPGVFINLDDKRIKIIATHWDKNGRLVIDRVKPEGKNEMSYEDFKRGYKKELIFQK